MLAALAETVTLPLSFPLFAGCVKVTSGTGDPVAGGVVGVLGGVAEIGSSDPVSGAATLRVDVVPLVIVCVAGCVVIAGGTGEGGAVVAVPLVIVCAAGCGEVPIYP